MAHKFEQRHFEAVADCIVEAKHRAQGELPLLQGIALLQQELINEFRRSNGNFDTGRFLNWIDKRCAPSA